MNKTFDRLPFCSTFGSTNCLCFDNVSLASVFQYIAPDTLPVAFEDIPRPPGHRDAVVNAFVYVHQTLHQANNRLAKRGGRSMAVTPRHYLDFINHYVCSTVCCDPATLHK